MMRLIFGRRAERERPRIISWCPASGIGRALVRALLLSACIVVLPVIGAAHAEPVVDAETTEEPKPAAELPEMEVPPKSTRVMLPGNATSRSDFLTIIEAEARRAGIAAEIVEAVTHTESGFNRNIIGADGEIGLMQLMPATARMLGFSGSLAELAVPETNIRYGVTYLARALRLAGGDLCTAVMKYRAGHGESRFSHLSVSYCLKVRARLASRGFAVVGTVPVATFGNPGSAGRCSGRCLAGSRGGPNFAALNSKLSQIAFRVTVQRVPTP